MLFKHVLLLLLHYLNFCYYAIVNKKERSSNVVLTGIIANYFPQLDRVVT